MKKKKITALVLSLVLAVTGTVASVNTNKVKAADYGLSNPRIDSTGNVTWDCAYFGSYPTAEVTKKPIKWRVLSIDENNNAFIVADKNLDCRPYNEEWEVVTWETSTIRSWLNGYGASSNIDGDDYSMDNFIDNAFTEEEQAAIYTTTVINAANPEHGIIGCNNTEDKVYLLSGEEVSNAEYGFDNELKSQSKKREVRNTDYAKLNGVYTSENPEYAGNGTWWLRSSGPYSVSAHYIGESGYYQDVGAFIEDNGVRPALNINLSASSVWEDAGITDSEGNDGITDGKINNPVVDNGVTTWDCIFFGNYNQTVTWTKAPIKWRVLSVDGDDAFFVADKNLDCKKYNEKAEDVTWETCTLRSWLNGYGADSNVKSIDYSKDNFINDAFTEEEQAAIKVTTVINNDNPEYEIEGGNNTEDKVYLLSVDEVSNTEYGFDRILDDIDISKTREAKNSDYAKFKGLATRNSPRIAGNGTWWLRSTGSSSDFAISVDSEGYVSIYGVSVAGLDRLKGYGVRPALHINLASSVWEKAGVVMSNDKVVDDGGELISSPSPTAEPGINSVSQPTQAPVVTQTPTPVQTIAPVDTSKTNEKVKTFKLSSLKIKKNATKITGKVSVAKVTVKIKVGKKAWKKAKIKGKKFTLKTAKLKKNIKVQIKVSKKGYKTLKKSYKVK